MNKQIYVFGSWLDSRLKEKQLIKNINFVKSKKFPVCLVTHYPISTDVQRLVDYYIYDKENILSENWWLRFWKINKDGIKEERDSPKPYHGLTCLMNMHNAISFLLNKNKFEYMHFWENGSEYDFDKYMNYFNQILKQNKRALFFSHLKNIFRTDIFSIDIETFKYCIPNAQTWKEYTECGFTETFILENWFTHFIKQKLSKNEYLYIEDFKVTDSWLQSDCVIWEDDPRGELQLPEVSESFKIIINHLYSKRRDVNIFEVRLLEEFSNKLWEWYVKTYGGKCYWLNVEYFLGTNECYSILLNSIEKFDLMYINKFIENNNEEAQLKFLLLAIERLELDGLFVINNSTSLIDKYLSSDKRFFCVYRNKQIVFRKDLEAN
jgi:hypothetical protein